MSDAMQIEVQKKQAYIEARNTALSYLKQLIVLLEKNGEEPLSGEDRKIFMEKFSALDHRLLDRLDVASFEYYEAKNNHGGGL